MAKNDNSLWIIGSLFLIVFFIMSEGGDLGKQDEFASIDVHYYKDGKEVFPDKGLFSIITPPGSNYDQISFEAVVTNTGNVTIENLRVDESYIRDGNLNKITSSPFSSAFSTTNLGNLKKGESITVSSDIINTDDFESYTQPINFQVVFSGENQVTGNRDVGGIGNIELAIEAEGFGDGSDGELIFTTTTKSYGNLVEGTDYYVSGNTLYLKVNNVFNFSSFTLGSGTELRPYNPGSDGVASAIYIQSRDAVINGTVLSKMSAAKNPVNVDVSTTFNANGNNIQAPGVADGGNGGNGGAVTFNSPTYYKISNFDGGYASSGTVRGGYGGSAVDGFGGGGGGGSAFGDMDPDSSYDDGRAGAGGSGGNGRFSGGSGGSGGNSPRTSDYFLYIGGQGGSSAGGGGASVGSTFTDIIEADGGNGGDAYGNSGQNAYAYKESGSDVVASAGGGGGAGGDSGYEGIHFYLLSGDISFNGEIDTSGTNGGNGGNGGDGTDRASACATSFSFAGGGGGGGGGGGNAGNIVFKYKGTLSDTGTKIMNGGSGGSGGSGGYGNGQCGAGGQNGNSGSSGSSGSQGIFSSTKL